jgi:tetratricopeptide (TPR) repeat protein
MNLGYSTEALSDFDEALRLSKFTYSDAFGNRAFIKYSTGDFTGAMQDCEKALQLDSENLELKSFKESIPNQ